MNSGPGGRLADVESPAVAAGPQFGRDRAPPLVLVVPSLAWWPLTCTGRARQGGLLAGPMENSRDARRLVNALSEKGIETFAYTSPEGIEIKELN